MSIHIKFKPLFNGANRVITYSDYLSRVITCYAELKKKISISLTFCSDQKSARQSHLTHRPRLKSLVYLPTGEDSEQ